MRLGWVGVQNIIEIKGVEMIWLSESDLNNFFGEVVRSVAKEIKLTDWELYFHTELLEQIRSRNAVVSQKLDAFFDSYKKWHAFHVEIERGNKVGGLSAHEKEEMQAFMSARDASREALLKELRS